MFQNNTYVAMLEGASAECTVECIKNEASVKPDASYPTNNNNVLYTNRNAYDHEPTPQQVAEEQEAAQVQVKMEPLASATDTSITANGGSSPEELLVAGDDSSRNSLLVVEPLAQMTDSGDGQPVKLETHKSAMEAKFKLYRRPINDFLMFCKRHRRIVSKHFISKENRFITKKLGVWWSQLSEKQKQPYKELANKHKAKYLAAFPEYRWGKPQQKQKLEFDTEQQVVTPPQVSPDAVQSSGEADSASPMTNEPTPILAGSAENRIDDQNDGSIEVAKCLVEMAAGVGLPPMTTFKLADETQMGSLSTLMTVGNGGTKNPPMRTDMLGSTFEHNYSITHYYVEQQAGYNGNPRDSDPYEQNPRTDTNNLEEPCRNMRQHFLSQSRLKTERPTAGTCANASKVASPSSLSFGAQNPDGLGSGPVCANSTTSRASRSCKGKRYQEFMNQQQVRHPNGWPSSSGSRKLQHKRPTSSTITSAALANDDSNATLTLRKTSASKISQHREFEDIMTADSTKFDLVPDDDVLFAMYDELYAKIDELPCFELNDFLANYKGDRKRKKPYALSSKGSKKRKCIQPKNSIPTPSSEPIASTSLSPPSVPTTIILCPVVPAPPNPVSTTPLPPAVPAKIVGCRKRKAPKEHIARHTTL